MTLISPGLVGVPGLDPEEETPQPCAHLRTQPAGFVLLRAGWTPGGATGAGAPLHHTYLMATTMSFAGITAPGRPAFAPRTSRASPRDIGVCSNPLRRHDSTPTGAP